MYYSWPEDYYNSAAKEHQELITEVADPSRCFWRPAVSFLLLKSFAKQIIYLA